jgi:hypothetical protein
MTYLFTHAHRHTVFMHPSIFPLHTLDVFQPDLDLLPLIAFEFVVFLLLSPLFLLFLLTVLMTLMSNAALLCLVQDIKPNVIDWKLSS